MAIKLNYKAYDHEDWNFLEQLMRKLGFNKMDTFDYGVCENSFILNPS